MVMVKCDRPTGLLVSATVVLTLLVTQFIGYSVLVSNKGTSNNVNQHAANIRLLKDGIRTHKEEIDRLSRISVEATSGSSFMTQAPEAQPENTTPILAIPLMFRVGCDTMLPEVQRTKLEARANAMLGMLKKHNLPSNPASFCNQEQLDDPRPICKNNQSERIDNAIKTINLAKNFMNAFLTCSKQTDYKVCLIMEDDTILHPNFTLEANALMEDLPADWQLVHLCPGFMRGNAGPRQYTKGRINRLEDWKWFPQPNVDFGVQKCKGLGCNATTRTCALASLKKRYWVKDAPYWGDQINTYVPCVSWVGGPQAYLVKPAEATYLAEHVSKKIYCGVKQGPNDLALSYQSRDSFKRHHYMARDPQLCFEPGNDEKSSSFSSKS
eukprot:m.718774 g.718774  ORF g.718774 m.718774 type:complete len:382 (+) comp22997_c1_seq22:126-1271(+)